MLMKIYKKLLNHFGPQGWWPMSKMVEPPEWEVCVGAILTQNTNWKNVEKALTNLKIAESIDPQNIMKMDTEKLAELIKPSGFYNQKAERLKKFTEFVMQKNSVENFLKTVTREELLQFNGIGPETADSILLYACKRKNFVVDAYTKRILKRVGIIETDDYEEIRKMFEEKLPSNIRVYSEYHALLVRLGKTNCKKEPVCETCPLTKMCKKKI